MSSWEWDESSKKKSDEAADVAPTREEFTRLQLAVDELRGQVTVSHAHSTGVYAEAQSMRNNLTELEYEMTEKINALEKRIKDIEDLCE